MRRRPGQVLRLGVAADGVALACHARRAPATLLAEQTVDVNTPQALGAAAAALLAAHGGRGWPLSVVLGADLVHLFDVTPPAQASRMSDLEAAAAVRLQRLFGVAPGDFRIAANWSARHGFLAAAVPQLLVDELSRAAASAGAHVVEVAPQLVAVLNRWRRALPQDAWFGHVHAGSLALAVHEDGALVALRVVPLPHDGAALMALVEREALRLGLALPAEVLLAGTVPAAWVASSEAGGIALRWLDQASPASSPLAALACSGSAA